MVETIRAKCLCKYPKEISLMNLIRFLSADIASIRKHLNTHVYLWETFLSSSLSSKTYFVYLIFISIECFSGYILNEPQQCINGHLYCLSCIGEWKKRGNKACPACGADASVGENNEIELTIGSKYVRCVFDCCQWKGRLERLNHHVVNSHGLSNESHVNGSCESLYSGDSLERHKQMQEIIRSQFMKKDAIIRRIKKMEKRNKRRIFGRESAKTEVPEPVISRTEIFRPFSDIVTINLSDTTPQVRWPTIDLNKDNFNQGRLKSLDVTKFIRRLGLYL